MVILDATVVNVALPSIGRSLHFDPAGLQWIVTAYVLASGGLVLAGGRAADLAGRRRMFLIGLTVFTAASLASGLAVSPAALIAARAGQGVGAALLTPAALSIITTAYVGAQRATALATWGALGGAGAAAGVLAGGVLTSWLGWRSVFLINVPVGAAAGLLSLRLVPTHRAPALAAGPLLPPRLLRSRSLVAGVLIMFGATGLLVGTFFLNSLYLQGVQHASALRTGLEFLPLALVIGASAHLGSRLLPAAGTRVMITAGLLLMGGGALLLTGLAPGSGYLAGVLPGLLVIGAGTGLVLPGASVTALSGVAASEAGAASGLMTAAPEIGAAVGVAVFSAAGVAVTGGVAAGYRHGFAVATAVASGLAVTAAVLVPAVRPAPGAPVAVH